MIELHIHIHHRDERDDAGHIQLVQLLNLILQEQKKMITVQNVKDAVKAACDQAVTDVLAGVDTVVSAETAKVVTLLEALPTAANIQQSDLDDIVASVKAMPASIGSGMAAKVGTIDTAAAAQAAADAAAAAGATTTGSTQPPPPPDQPGV